MALSDPRAFFGVHAFSPYRRSDGTFYGTVKVIGDSSFSLAGELVNLNGGSNTYNWATEDGLTTAELSLTFREYPNFVIELFLGKAPTDTAAEASGNVSTLTNKNGTSVQDATTGIASVGATAADEADLKFTKYVAKAVSATEVDVFAGSDIDFARGTDGDYLSDDLKIAESVTIPGTGGTVALADYGLEFTGGSGSIAMTTDDTATFEVRPINTGSTAVTIGSTTDTRAEFGALLLAAKRGNGELLELDVFKVKASGLPLGLTENAWSEASTTAQASYDSAKDGVFSMRFVKG